MKKIVGSALVFTITCAMFSSCGSSRPVYVVQSAPQSNNPFGETYEMPCAVYDSPEFFAATGIYKGSSNQKGELQKNALANAQQLIRMKMQHSYKGLVSDYSNTFGNNRGNDIETKLENGGDQIIDVIVNNTEAECVKFGGVGNDGMIECYVGVKISKQELAKKVAEQVKNMLSDEEKMRINFNESNFRKRMEQKFESYKEANR